MFVHHAGKTGTQRGTSRREDLLDTVLTLKRPSDSSPDQGLRCEVHFEKTRAMLGDSAKPFEVKLETGPDGRAVWIMRDLENVKRNQAWELYESGATVREVRDTLGISQGMAGRMRQEWYKTRDRGRSVPASHSIGTGQWNKDSDGGERATSR